MANGLLITAVYRAIKAYERHYGRTVSDHNEPILVISPRVERAFIEELEFVNDPSSVFTRCEEENRIFGLRYIVAGADPTIEVIPPQLETATKEKYAVLVSASTDKSF